MRIWVAVTLLVLVVLVVSNDVSARKSERAKSEKNKRSLAVEETSNRENDQSAYHGKKSKNVKSEDKSRGKRQRRSVDEVEPEVARNKKNPREDVEPLEERHEKKSRTTDPKHKNSQKTEIPLKNKKDPKEGKKVDSPSGRSAKTIGKPASVKKRSLDESVGADETGAHAKVSPSKVSTSRYSKRSKNVEKRENSYSEEGGAEKNESQEKRVRERIVRSEKERSGDKTVNDEAEPQENRRIKKKMEQCHQCGMGRRPEVENVLGKSRKKRSGAMSEAVKLEDEKSEAIVESLEPKDEEMADEEEEGADEEIQITEDEEAEVNEDEEVEANDDEMEEILENEGPLGSCPGNVADDTSECYTDRS